MKDLSTKEKLTKKTSLFLIFLGIFFWIVAFMVPVDMFILVSLFSLGIMVIALPLMYNYSCDDEKKTEQKQTPLTKNEFWGMSIFSSISFGVIGYLLLLQEWGVAIILSVFVGDIAVIFLFIVITDFRNKRNVIKHGEYKKNE